MEINGKVIELDFSKTDLGDWELFSRLSGGLKLEDLATWIEFLDRVVIGGKKAFPMSALTEVINVVAGELAEFINPKAPAVKP